MAKSAFDVAALLDVLCEGQTAFVRDLENYGKPLRIGVSDATPFPMLDAEGQDLFRQAASELGDVVKHAGIYVDGHLELFQEEDQCPMNLFRVNQRSDWDQYLAECSGEIRSLRDLIAWHDAHPVSPSSVLTSLPYSHVVPMCRPAC